MRGNYRGFGGKKKGGNVFVGALSPHPSPLLFEKWMERGHLLPKEKVVRKEFFHSRKLLNWREIPKSLPRTAAITDCSSSRLFPETRTCFSWIWAVTLNL